MEIAVPHASTAEAEFVVRLADTLTALACFAIVVTIVRIVRRRPGLAAPYRRIAWLVAVFLTAIGLSDIVSVLPLQGSGLPAALLRLVFALVGAAMLALAWRLPRSIAALPSHQDMREANARLITEAEAHVKTLRELSATRDELEQRVAERTAALDEARLRYELALRGSEVTLFLQDQDLRYIWISRPFLDRAHDEIVGHSDEEIIPEASRTRVMAVKRAALESGENQDAELALTTPDGTIWWDLHVQPQLDAQGRPHRIYCAAVEITGRKESEQKLRFLMREVMHRSKNMLAVIQAMARQTAASSDTIDGFLNRFGDRLQALSASQDLLVEESGRGVPLDVLVRSQLGYVADQIGTQITLDGPRVTLSADATQHIGLALHELATNATKYGALSTPAGRVTISWSLEPRAPDARNQEPRHQEPRAADGRHNGADACDLYFRMSWREEGGPPVSPPSRRGFGQVVIERTVARTLNGSVDLRYAPEGLNWSFQAPAQNVLPQPDG